MWCATATLIFAVSGCEPEGRVLPDPPDYAKHAEVEWTLVFQDDFEGEEVNDAHWSMYDGPGHAGNGYRKPEAFSVADGVLTVTASMVDGEIVSGGMAHKIGLKYGKFEARLRADDDPSLATSAVFLTWPDSERWPVDGENNIFETGTNRRQSFHTFVHYGEDNKQHQVEHTIDVTKWLDVAMEWEPTRLRIFINGALAWTLTDTNAIPHNPHHACIQLDAFAKVMEGVVTMQVDWVKVYERVVID